MKRSLTIGLTVAALFAVAALASTPSRQVLFGPGSPVTLTGATKAAPGATATAGLGVDTVSTVTNGYLLDLRNNTSSKAHVDFAGVATVAGVVNTGATSITAATTKAAGSASCGKAALDSSGTVTIATTAVTANSIIFLNRSVAGGTAGTLYAALAADITAGTSFIIRSYSSGTTAATTDTSTIQWCVVN
jgi:hypothetical protein